MPAEPDRPGEPAGLRRGLAEAFARGQLTSAAYDYVLARLERSPTPTAGGGGASFGEEFASGLERSPNRRPQPQASRFRPHVPKPHRPAPDAADGRQVYDAEPCDVAPGEAVYGFVDLGPDAYELVGATADGDDFAAGTDAGDGDFDGADFGGDADADFGSGMDADSLGDLGGGLDDFGGGADLGGLDVGGMDFGGLGDD